MKLLHSSATNTSVSTENKEAILRDVVDRFIQQYGPDSIAYLNVFPYQQTPIINRVDLLDTIRPEEFFKVSYSDLIGNVQYETSAIFSNHSMFLRQAGKENNKCVVVVTLEQKCFCINVIVIVIVIIVVIVIIIIIVIVIVITDCDCGKKIMLELSYCHDCGYTVMLE